MPRFLRPALLAVGLSAAAGAALASAHGAPHPVIHGPAQGKLGVIEVVDDQFDFDDKITLDCPPPDGAKPCKVVVTVKTTNKYKLRKSARKAKNVTLGKVRYKIASNRELAPVRALPLSEKGHKALHKFGPFLKARVRVKITHNEPIVRHYRLTLKGEEHEE